MGVLQKKQNTPTFTYIEVALLLSMSHYLLQSCVQVQGIGEDHVHQDGSVLSPHSPWPDTTAQWRQWSHSRDERAAS